MFVHLMYFQEAGVFIAVVFDHIVVHLDRDSVIGCDEVNSEFSSTHSTLVTDVPFSAAFKDVTNVLRL